jgi:predicted amidohydrolase
MSRVVKLATVQPPAPAPGRGTDEVIAAGIDLLRQAGEAGADLCCLPECLNVIGCEPAEARQRAASEAEGLIARVADIAASHRLYVALPLILARGRDAYNSTVLLDRAGVPIGHYDKVHLTQVERDDWGLTAGDDYPVFELDFGRVAILTCYDGCFPEPARIVALAGAEVLLFASLQRSYTESILTLQVRARAYDNALYVVRSSYGTPRDEPWRPGMIVGKSCIVAPDATIIADLGRWTGMVTADVDLDQLEIGERSHGGEIGVLRDFRLEDRRPDTYGRLCE